MKKVLPIGFIIVTVYHTLACKAVAVAGWWQIQTTRDGLLYRGHYYAVVGTKARQATLSMAGSALENRSVAHHNLPRLSGDDVQNSGESYRKATRFLKLRLTDYSPFERVVFHLLVPTWRKAIRIPEQAFVLLARSLSIHSPPSFIYDLQLSRYVF